MRENVTICYRGSGYELGQGPRCYGIWAIGAPRSQPLERWPDTAAGWSAASLRFTQLEAPGTIVPVSQRGTPRRASTRASAIVAAAVLGAGVACGLIGLFPAYLGGASLARQSSELVPHLIYLAAWSASAVLVLLPGTRQRVGALLGLGTSVVTFGLFLADAGQVIAGGTRLLGAGLVLGLAGWLACAAGSVLALRLRPAGPVGAPGRPGQVLGRLRGDGHRVAAIVSVLVAGLGAAIAFAPAWDRYTLRTPGGVVQSLTMGNAFREPAPMIAGNVAVMVAVVGVVLLAAMWRPIRLGAALLAGATIPLAAQAISALVQLGQPSSPLTFGIPPAQAARAGLTIGSSATFAFWVYCAFVVALALSCAQMILMPDAVTPDPAGAPGERAADKDLVRADVAADVRSGEVTSVSPVSPPGESPVVQARINYPI